VRQRERERERERDGRGVAHEGARGGEIFQGASSIHTCPTLLQGVSLYRREGERLPHPHQVFLVCPHLPDPIWEGAGSQGWEGAALGHPKP
jgi:hypothetical protein